MGIRFLCPSGHKLNVKNYLAGKRAICPECGAKVIVPDPPPEPAAASPVAGEISTNPFASPSDSAAPALLDAASPSVVLEMDDIELDVPAAVTGLPVTVFATTGPIIDTVQPGATTSDTQDELRRDQARRNQMMLLVILGMVVIILAGVLIWVLNRDVSEPTEQESSSASVVEEAPSSETAP